ncbi:MAG: SDR family oxidoreductase [Nitrospirota bacterium]|nr:SDR family oxidoreductase [Nitrospirota bacterium]MDH5587395.1 SDR family oxidoreductase [Nitrospirota bacterium]
MNESEFSLDGKIILVTGAGGLIGQEVCDAYGAYGATVIATDNQSSEKLHAQIARLNRRYPEGNFSGISADVTSEESVGKLFHHIQETYHQLDVLVNLAAIDAKFDDGQKAINLSRFEHYPLELWERSVAVNATGLIRVTQHAVRLMLPRRSGHIINVASTYSLVAPNQSLYETDPETAPVFKPIDYVGTKSMVPNFSRYIATFYAREGIRCNTVVPHGIMNQHPKAFQDNFAKLSPLGRMCELKEIRGPFVFLASHASSYMTGSTLVVDGGWTAW